MNDIEQLQKAIRSQHGCGSEHVRSVNVQEFFNGETVWEGTVEVFSIRGNYLTDIAYGWSHTTDDGELRHAVVLGLPPINSAADAVRARRR